MHDEQPHLLDLSDVDRSRIALVGGKAAALGELLRIDGVRVPPGFVVTTAADPDDDAVAVEIAAALADRGDATTAWAVRSSATAEDLPTASFAGQHDSFLDVAGAEAVLDAVRRCRASLATERAVAYRARQGIEDARMAVVVQRMVHPRAAGVLFTADPISGNRHVASVEAVAGLGEALVSGLVTPDTITVRDDVVLTRTTAGAEPVLTDAEVVALVRLGRRLEAHLGSPQDVEWCLTDDGDLHVVQSRPITTLFPIPPVDDDGPHVWISTGHQQMMTDAMTPLGLSVWLLMARRPMDVAGSRIFVDIARELAVPAAKAGIVAMLGRSDPLIRDALETLDERGFVPSPPDDGAPPRPPAALDVPPIETDPAIVTELIAADRESVAALRRALDAASGPAALDIIEADVEATRATVLAPRSHAAIVAGMEAAWWLNEHMEAWLGEIGAADALSLSAPGNVTAEMGLALLDVADVVRPHPEVVALLERADDGFLDALPSLSGGSEAKAAVEAYLDAYGMRGAGEIDIARPRWGEQPSALVPMILGHVRAFAPGEAARRVEEGCRRAEATAQDLLARLRTGPDGEARAAETERTIERLRTFAGYREYPKYGMVSRMMAYKEALLAVAADLVADDVLDDVGDIAFLTFAEIREAAVAGADGTDLRPLVAERRATFRTHQALTPPRVLTSEGEALHGSYRRDDVPEGALVGLAVSSGTVEGRARVVLDMADAALEPGDILVTTFTDPSWSPLFVAASGLVTEVGGQMTHGAVVAREYGLPAVVSVGSATRLITDGQRIRVDGTHGVVELLPAENENAF